MTVKIYRIRSVSGGRSLGISRADVVAPLLAVDSESSRDRSQCRVVSYAAAHAACALPPNLIQIPLNSRLTTYRNELPRRCSSLVPCTRSVLLRQWSLRIYPYQSTFSRG